MSTPPVRVAITADDFSGPAFNSATAKANTFKRSVDDMGGSFHQANVAARLFNEELGTGLSRHLTAIIAQSAFLGPALSAALPLAAFVGFAEVAKKIYDHISGANQEATKLAHQEKLAESFRKVAEEVAKIQASIRDIGQSSQKVAINAMVEAQFALISLQARVSMQRSMAEDLERQSKQQEKATAENITKTGAEPNSPFPQKYMAEALKKQADDAATKIPALQAKLDEATRLMGQSFIDLAAQAAVTAQRAENAWVTAMDEAKKKTAQLVAQGEQESAPDRRIREITDELGALDKIKAMRKGINETANEYIEKLTVEKTLIEEQEAASIRESLAKSRNAKRDIGELFAGDSRNFTYGGTKQAMDLLRIQTDGTYASEEAAKAIEHAQTASQKYSETIERLTALEKAGALTHAQYAQAAKKAGQDMDGTTKYMREFGREVGRNLEQALMFQESWKKAFESILESLLKLILQMYVFRSLSAAFGGASGGFLGSLFSGMAGGHASGGYIPPGQWGMVGEMGPELAYGGSSGLNITPNSALGGTVVQHFDMRGSIVTDDVVRKAELAGAMRQTESRAVQRAIAGTSELSQRR